MPVNQTTISGINPASQVRSRFLDTNLGDPGGTVTLTVEQILGGSISLTPTVNTILQLPTATEFDTNYLVSQVGARDTFPLTIRNFGAALTITLTLTAPGNTISGGAVIGGGNYKQFDLTFDGDKSSFTLYDSGTTARAANPGVEGPASSTDQSVAVFSGTSGQIIAESATPTLLTTGTNFGVGPATTLASAIGGSLDNTAVGSGVLAALTTGDNNTALGGAAGASIVDADNNTLVGQLAGSALTSANNTCVGQSAGAVIVGGAENTCVGVGADVASSSSDDIVAIGFGATSTRQGVSIGHSATAGNSSITIGEGAGSTMTSSVTIGAGAAVLSQFTASGNVFIGVDAATALTTGDDNVLIGRSTGTTLATGRNVVLVGESTNVGAAGSSDCIGIGSGATAVATDTIVLDTDDSGMNTQSFFVPRLNQVMGVGNNVTYNSATGEIHEDASSLRFKENIQNLRESARLIDALRPVEFDYKETGTHSIGLIAEEVHEVLPEIVPLDRGGKPTSIRYDLLTPLLLQEIQRLRARVEALEK